MPPVSLPRRVVDLRGRTFGLLTVRRFDCIRDREAYWLCDCACGVRGKSIRGKNLRQGLVISCGCLRADSEIRAAARSRVDPRLRSAIARLGAAANNKRRISPLPTGRRKK